MAGFGVNLEVLVDLTVGMTLFARSLGRLCAWAWCGWHRSATPVE